MLQNTCSNHPDPFQIVSRTSANKAPFDALAENATPPVFTHPPNISEHQDSKNPHCRNVLNPSKQNSRLASALQLCSLAWHHFDGHFCPILWGHRQSMVHSPGQTAKRACSHLQTQTELVIQWRLLSDPHVINCDQTPGPNCSQAVDHTTGRGAWGLHICDYL